MKHSVFSYSFGKKPDPEQWAVLKQKLPSHYSLPDIAMLANIHRSRIPIATMSVHDWLNSEKDISGEEEKVLTEKIKHLLPPDYVIPDTIRLKNIFIK